MRYLHKPNLKEQFVASGVYHFYKNDALVAGVEHWSISELPDGSRFIRVDADWRDFDGSSQLVEALYQPTDSGGRIDRFVRHWVYSGYVERERYDFFDKSVMIGYDDEDGVRQDYEESLADGYFTLLSMEILLGIGAGQLAQTPEIDHETFCGFDMHTAESIVAPMLVKPITTETLTIDGKPHLAHHWALYDVNLPDERQHLWLDSHGILVKRLSSDHTLTLLSQYAHRP